MITKKIALYSRVSTDKQTTDNQKLRLLEYAKYNNIDYEIFDEVESTRNTRPVKQILLDKLRNKEFESVVVYKLDRWARSSTELILEIKELIDKNIGFISLTDNIDFTTASGILHFHILSAMAEFERALISERTKEGLRRTKSTGTILGRPVGSKDKKNRKRAGYLLRNAKERMIANQKMGIYNDLEHYISPKAKNTPPNK
jgi:putative DNA-invertase from lambdoid prophage Rac